MKWKMSKIKWTELQIFIPNNLIVSRKYLYYSFLV